MNEGSGGEEGAASGDDGSARMLRDIARHEGVLDGARSPLLKNPADCGLAYENVWFPAQDGGAAGGVVHPSRGFGQADRRQPSALVQPPRSARSPGSLAVGRRGHRQRRGVNSGGRFEARDVLGSLAHVHTRPDLKDMTIGLFSRGQGANASIFAMAEHSGLFQGALHGRGTAAVGRVLLQRVLERLGLSDRLEELDREIKAVAGFALADLSPVEAAKRVTVPTFLYQVHDDALTRPGDPCGGSLANLLHPLVRHVVRDRREFGDGPHALALEEHGGPERGCPGDPCAGRRSTGRRSGTAAGRPRVGRRDRRAAHRSSRR